MNAINRRIRKSNNFENSQSAQLKSSTPKDHKHDNKELKFTAEKEALTQTIHKLTYNFRKERDALEKEVESLKTNLHITKTKITKTETEYAALEKTAFQLQTKIDTISADND